MEGLTNRSRSLCLAEPLASAQVLAAPHVPWRIVRSHHFQGHTIRPLSCERSGTPLLQSTFGWFWYAWRNVQRVIRQCRVSAIKLLLNSSKRNNTGHDKVRSQRKCSADNNYHIATTVMPYDLVAFITLETRAFPNMIQSIQAHR